MIPPALPRRKSGQYCTYGKCNEERRNSSDHRPCHQGDQVTRAKLFDRYCVDSCRDGEAKCPDADGHGDVQRD